MASNPQKSPKAKVIGAVAKQAKASKAAKVKTVAENSEVKKQAEPDENAGG